MKHILRLALLLLLTVSANSLAQNSTKNYDVRDKIVLTNREIKNEPRDVRYETVECYYGDGVLDFVFNVRSGRAKIKVTDLFTGQSHSADVPMAVGSYQINVGVVCTAMIEIKTSQGDDLIGYVNP